MMLDTGKHLHCNKWTQLTITEDIIDIVHDLCHDARIDIIYKIGLYLIDILIF